MINTATSKAKQCCIDSHRELMRELSSCNTLTSGKKHACYRRAAKTSGRRARKCIAAG